MRKIPCITFISSKRADICKSSSRSWCYWTKEIGYTRAPALQRCFGPVNRLPLSLSFMCFFAAHVSHGEIVSRTNYNRAFGILDGNTDDAFCCVLLSARAIHPQMFVVRVPDIWGKHPRVVYLSLPSWHLYVHFFFRSPHSVLVNDLDE